MPMNVNPPPIPSSNYGTASPSVTVILTIILLVFFFLGFFSVYFCRCFLENVSNSWHIRRTPSGNNIGAPDASVINGLDHSLIQSFPTFLYSSVKDFRKEKYGLECAICLVEFEDDSLLRLLTVCYHVFHQECIDLWLESHKTCPVCRRNLDMPPESSLKKSPHDHNAAVHGAQGSNEALEGSVRIDIKEYENDHGSSESAGESHERASSKTTRENNEANKVERFSRSHSTGHSLVRKREGDDRYTLRLPEHVEVRLLRGHNGVKSCTVFGEFSHHTAGSD
ncbi:RING-H2 finger protein ATL29-like [Corylus avellana]|uniref:RING-H2 finger protein ATL29-like n=1 Tax=Corylus avellana TaxID=13451 RepID=UPI00286C1928|nr:RING-H2 finger protein ATL29-like [Corylus avellana]